MPIKLIIIGGVAGGATAAARARRLNETAEIILLERGEYISFANCGLPYYIGNAITNRGDLLVTTPRAFKERYNIDIRIFSDVIKIDRENKEIRVRDLKTGKEYKEKYDKIILSPGAEPVRPRLEGIDSEKIFSLRNIPDTDRIKNYIDNNKPEAAVIVGAGFIGIEMAENLVERGVKTTIIEMLDQVLAPFDFEMAAVIQAHLESKGVKCLLSNPVRSFNKSENKLIVNTEKGDSIPCDLVLLSIGIKPENKLAGEAGLELGSRGGIIVDAAMTTSDPDIYAAGDAVEIRDFITGQGIMTPLAGPANKQGRIAADNAMGRRSVYKGTMGAAIVKAFDYAAACAGASEKTLERLNIPHEVSYTHSASHASYYPGAGMLSIKIIFSPGRGKIFGAQIIGTDGVDKRIDVLAAAIRGGMTVFDLEELELAYAPPFSSAKDPVNIAGFVAGNILRGDVEIVTWKGIKDIDAGNTVLIDVRAKGELAQGTIKGSLHIPIDELRGRYHELDKTKTYILFCAVGFRGYVGCRILKQLGFKVKNLSGGYRTYQYALRA